QYEPETYFVAVYNGTDGEGNSDHGLGAAFARQNEVVGVVSAQLRRRSPLIAGPSNGDDPSNSALPSVPIPCPHVYLANMRVDGNMRRKGVGMALLSSVREYANSWSKKMNEEIPIVLSVDNDNSQAIGLYEKFGFDYLESNSVFCIMTLNGVQV
ncbi:hypothetical protein ACHAXR_003222, partial [Thalassiosira sp. AJA248-18]